MSIKKVHDNQPKEFKFSNENLKKAIVLVARQHPPEIPGGTFAFNSFYETFFDKDYHIVRGINRSIP